jgi:hypothetical protein
MQCNNPLTKEPKLDRAKRILPEWEGLDKQVALVRKQFEAGLPIEPLNKNEDHTEL